MIRFGLAVAAGIILMILLKQIIPVENSSTDDLFAQTYEPYPATLSDRAMFGNESQIKAESLYNAKNYPAALLLLEKLYEKDFSNSNVNLIIGNTHLAMNQTKDAIVYFEKIIENNDPLYVDQARWYLALAYLKDGKISECKKILNELRQDPNADFHEEAKALLEDL